MTEQNDGQVMTEFVTPDIYFASYLCAEEIMLVSADSREDRYNRDKKRVFFKFNVQDSVIKRLKRAYDSNTATVKAKRFVQEIKSMKQLCFDTTKG